MARQLFPFLADTLPLRSKRRLEIGVGTRIDLGVSLQKWNEFPICSTQRIPIETNGLPNPGHEHFLSHCTTATLPVDRENSATCQRERLRGGVKRIPEVAAPEAHPKIRPVGEKGFPLLEEITRCPVGTPKILWTLPSPQIAECCLPEVLSTVVDEGSSMCTAGYGLPSPTRPSVTLRRLKPTLVAPRPLLDSIAVGLR